MPYFSYELSSFSTVLQYFSDSDQMAQGTGPWFWKETSVPTQWFCREWLHHHRVPLGPSAAPVTICY